LARGHALDPRLERGLVPAATRAMRVPLVIAIFVLAPGCFERPLSSADPCTRVRVGVSVQDGPIDEVDLLFVIDDSSSMAEEQASVITEIPRAIQLLASGDRNGDGSIDFTPPRSLHVGIISTDMGVGDVTGVATCSPGFGDDGVLRIDSAHGAGCPTDLRGTYPAGVFDFYAGSPVLPAQFATDVACVAALGTAGCEYEAQLEAPLKALTPAPTGSGGSPVPWTHAGYRPPTFFGDTYGHGSDPTTNGAFVRPASVLAIVIVSDEDDCSTPTPRIFSPDDPAYVGSDPSPRCHTFASELWPIERYVDGFIGLRANPALLMFGAIVGIPPARSGMSATEILSDPAMQERIDPAHPSALVPSCIAPGGSAVASPPIRITQLAGALYDAGATTTVQSICNTDFSPAFEEIIRLVSEAIDGHCLYQPLDPDGNGFVDCDVDVVLPPMAHCSELEHPEAYERRDDEVARLADGTEVRREVCRMRQVGRAGAGREAGWAYDDGDARLAPGWSHLAAGCTQDIALSLIEPVFGAEGRLSCERTLLAPTSGPVAIGAPCDPSTGLTRARPSLACSAGTAAPGNAIAFSCDPFRDACQIACARDEDCVAAGLPSYQCDQRTAAAYFDVPPTGIAADDIHGFCVRPTCGPTR
jgi:hypothetical protein